MFLQIINILINQIILLISLFILEFQNDLFMAIIFIYLILVILTLLLLYWIYLPLIKNVVGDKLIAFL